MNELYYKDANSHFADFVTCLKVRSRSVVTGINND